MAGITIQLTVEQKKAIDALNQVGNSFDTVASKASKAGDASSKTSNTLNSLAGKFVTFEFAKKMAAFADESLRAAAAMEGIDAAAKEAATSYVEIADGTKIIGANMVTWAATLVNSTGLLSHIAGQISEIAESWEFMATGQTKATRDMAKEMAGNDVIAALRTMRGEQKKVAEYEALGQWEFFDKASEAAKKAEDDFKILAKQAKLTDEQIMALKAGKSWQYIQDPEMMGRFNGGLKPAPASTNRPALKKGKIDLLTVGPDNSPPMEEPGFSDAQKEAYSKSWAELEAMRAEGYDTRSLADIEAEERTAKEIDILSKERYAREEANMIEAWDTERTLRAEKTDDEFDDLEAEYAKKKEMYLLNAEYQKEVDSWHAREFKKLEDEKKKKAIDSQLAIASASAGLAGSLSALMKAAADDNKEMISASMALAEIEAIINTAVGVTQALRQSGPLGILTGAAVTAAGAAQVITIEKERQKLWDGGIIEGPQTGDQVPVMANGGELALTKGDQVNLRNMIRYGGAGGASNFYFQPQYSADTPDVDKRRDYREFQRYMRSAQTDRGFGRVQAAYV